MVIADEALDYYKRKQTFPKGAFNECISFARKRAKEMTGKKKSACAPSRGTSAPPWRNPPLFPRL
ncbi:TPA: hypothetical protein SL694_006509 [Pseudomonas aeruginosa]|nr:hypothetical protein [Pseudomonas aeruginosa]